MKRSSVIIPFLVAGLLSCQTTSPAEGVTSTTESDITPSPTSSTHPTAVPFTVTPTFEPTMPATPDIEISNEVLSVNAQYVTIPHLGIENMYVNGYSSVATLSPNLLTQYSLACRGHSYDKGQNIWVPDDVDPSCIALLAHNYIQPGLSMEGGFSVGNEVFIKNDADQVLKYEIAKVLRYQAIPPLGNGQVLVDLDSGEVLTIAGIRQYIYNSNGDTDLGVGGNYLVIQTCIWEDTNGNGKKDPGDDGGDNWLWGRMFVIGRLVDVYDQNYLAGDYQLDGME